ncbi:PucR family transcriptional regulator [Tsukamurella soli]|uniref:Sugar diacid utilization regulator n=1 Tax=Tsukamurella soli TaxID=644556 RepID=A0ABP8JI51_9ACTN
MSERESLQRLVDTLAEKLGRSVVLDDPELKLIVASRHFGDADDQRVRAVLQRDVGVPAIGYILGHGVARWTSPGVIPANAELGMKSRLCYPVRWQAQLLGFLLVIDDDLSMTAAQKQNVVDAGHEAAVLLLGEQLGQDLLRREVEACVSGLLSAEPMRRDAAVRELDRLGVVRRSTHVSITVVELVPGHEPVESTEAASALRIATSGLARARSGYAAGVALGGRGVLLQTWDTPPGEDRLRDQAADLREAVRRVVGDHGGSVAGVGRLRTGLTAAHRAYDEACVAARAARRVPSLGGVALADELGPLELLLRLPDHELTDALVPEPLIRLRDADSTGRLLTTLRTYLDEGCSAPATAEALHLHRTSLYYRLERIQEHTGIDLNDGRARLLLHLGLYLLDIVG